MTPTLVERPAEGDWIHEVKFDGYRTQLVKDRAGVRAFTRRGHDWSDKYAPLVDAAAALPCLSAILDGEVIVMDASHRSSFHKLRSAITRHPSRLAFVAFD